MHRRLNADKHVVLYYVTPTASNENTAVAIIKEIAFENVPRELVIVVHCLHRCIPKVRGHEISHVAEGVAPERVVALGPIVPSVPCAGVRDLVREAREIVIFEQIIVPTSECSCMRPVHHYVA